MTDQKQQGGAQERRPVKHKRKSVRLTIAGRIVAASIVVLALIVCTVSIFRAQPSMTEKLSLTYKDSLTLADLEEKPQASYAERILAPDYTIYGTSLVFYDKTYSPLETDGFFGRNAKLKNIKTGDEFTYTFTGGADTGINLQTLEPGVYEVYLTNGYSYSRAYMDEAYSSEPFITMRNGKKVRSVRVDASADYLEKFGIESDENYLYLTVTETLPIVRITDVVIDPSGFLVDSNGMELPWFSEDGFDESEKSMEFARKIAEHLEDAGLRVTFSREDEQWKGYGGAASRAGIGYEAQAKVFLSLSMTDGDQPRPFFISSPFTNGVLGNEISNQLVANGIELYTPVPVAQLNAGNSYDQLSTDLEYQLQPFSLQPALRETGGRVTSAGKNESWRANSQYSKSNGMNALIFVYASNLNPDSRQYFLDHEDAMALSIAQGILNAYSIGVDLGKPGTPKPSADEQSSAKSSDNASSSDSVSQSDAEKTEQPQDISIEEEPPVGQ